MSEKTEASYFWNCDQSGKPDIRLRRVDVCHVNTKFSLVLKEYNKNNRTLNINSWYSCGYNWKYKK